MAQRARVNVLTHVPLDKALDETAAAAAVADGRILIPTLAMMEGVVAQSAPPGADYAAARQSVTVMYRAGVPILAGTDANAVGVPAAISHGASLHHELELLVDAGLSPLDALRAATSRPARYFGLADGGVIDRGRRADLVLIDGNPLRDITATRSIRRIWCGGVEVVPAGLPRIQLSATMRITVINQRLHLIQGAGAVDVHTASGGRFGPDAASGYECWAEFAGRSEERRVGKE